MNDTRSMMYKPLGRTGIEIPEVGLGTWGYHGGVEPLRRGFEAGALFVDTAESYESEPVVGEALRGLRDRVFLATKVSAQNLRGADLLRAADRSLLRLGVSHIDLYQIHHPNPEVPIEETMEAMEQLVEQGKVRYIGVSNFDVGQLDAARRALRKHSIVANQVRFNLADRTIEGGLLQYCQAHGITVIAYSPLAREISRLFDADPRGLLRQLSRETGRTVAQIAINWCLCREGVVAIPKGNSVDHVLENCMASGWRLTTGQIELLDAQILSRRRGRMDNLVRGLIPRGLIPFAKRCLQSLPRGLRRRLS